MDEWRSKFLRDMQTDLMDWEEEQNFHEQILFSGSLFAANLGIQSHTITSRKRRIHKDRKREAGHEMMWNDYFCDHPTYSDADFRRRFRMTKRLFNKLLVAISTHDDYFQQKRDAAKKRGLSGLQKMTATLHQLAFGVGVDATDEYYRLGDSTARKSLYRFCQAIRTLYEDQYLRKPTATDFARLLEVNSSRGFPGMFASLDCMHYEWKNCPVAWHGQFCDKDGKKSIILEAIANHELWFWHSFLSLPGGNNDLNVLDRSSLVNDIIHGKYTQNSYTVNGVEFFGAYLLVDGIYPKWSCFVQSIHQSQSEKNKHFAKCQEALQKDVERDFGVLQSRWGIVWQPARSWHIQWVKDVLMACVILHNMIIEDEREEHHGHEEFQVPILISTIRRGDLPWKDYLSAVSQLENAEMHFKLRNHLIEHLREKRGNNDFTLL